MDYIIDCTLQTLVGLTVISGWMLIGYAITRFWWHLIGEKIQYTWKTKLGIVSGPITILYMGATAFLNLIPESSI